MDRLFSLPINIIPLHSDIVIYGAGNNGCFLYNKIVELNIYNIVGIIDKNYEELKLKFSILHPPEWLKNNLSYDYLIISNGDRFDQMEILNQLLNIGISRKRIVTFEDFFVFVPEKTMPLIVNRKDNHHFKIGLFSKFCGLGDQIITLGLYKAIVDVFPNGIIDIWSDQLLFSKAVFIGQNNLGKLIANDDKLRREKYGEYDLFIEISFEILIKEFNKDKIWEYDKEFSERIQKQIEYQLENYVDCMHSTYSDLILAQRANKMGINRYGLLKGCLFDKIDEYAEIYIDEYAWLEFKKKGLPNRYITFSYGANGVCEGTKVQTKMWIPEHYSMLFDMIKQCYPDISIIQLGDKKAKHIDGADRYFLGEDLEIVKCILKKTTIHIDCEGGLTHLASHLGTRCIVMFGPTQAWFYGYKNNINLSSDLCNGCMGISKNYQFECMKYERPVCMSNITPQKVFSELGKYIDLL